MINGLKIHHIGVVVKQISEVSNILENTFEFDKKSIPFDDIFQKVKILFISIGNMQIELIEPLQNDSPVKKFLEKGGGVHHIAYETQNFDKDIKKLLDLGSKPLQEEPTLGFEGRRIFFFYMPKSGFKVIELVENKINVR